jgi:hypothetical protein
MQDRKSRAPRVDPAVSGGFIDPLAIRRPSSIREEPTAP